MQDLSLHILDIAENSINAGATEVLIYITEALAKNRLKITIEDNGKGIKKELLRKVRDPFYTTRTTRKVGLGLPLLEQAAQMCGGNLTIKSSEGKGTTITATFIYDHIDRKPLGDITQTVITLIGGHPEIDFLYCHKKNDAELAFDTKDIKKELEDIPINNVDILNFIKHKITDGLKMIK